MTKASASQNIFVALVLHHQNVPSAAFALLLEKCQHMHIKCQEIAHVRCAVDSGRVTNDNGMKTSLVIN